MTKMIGHISIFPEWIRPDSHKYTTSKNVDFSIYRKFFALFSKILVHFSIQSTTQALFTVH